jgi:hypothetical protein
MPIREEAIVGGARRQPGAVRGVTRRTLLQSGLGLSALLAGCATLPPQAPAPLRKKLIEFGADEPDPPFMRLHGGQMEQSPFDGCVFHVSYRKPDGTPGHFQWEAWGRRAFGDADLRPDLEALRTTAFERLRHNFLRFNVVPGDVDWFDDFSAVLTNARLAARVAKEGGAVGILFDTEQYNAPLFEYRKQRDAGAKPWGAYAAQARRRGQEVMAAFQAGYPGVTLLLTFAYSAPWQEMRRGAGSLRDCEYGLLAPFLDGMVDAAEGGTRLVDGCEMAYFHDKDRGRFAAAARTMRERLLPIVADPAKYRRLLSVGFGLWMDYDPTGKAWDGRDGSRNYYTPEEFEASVHAALAAADEYVWIYTQTPRWWSAGGGPVDLPAGYAAALRRAQERANR